MENDLFKIVTHVALSQEHEEAAQEADARRLESQERSDTDGFLSQWASGLTAARHRAQAEIERNGGKAEFPGLFDLEGNRVPAKLIEGAYGPCWALVDPKTNEFTGEFIGYKASWRKPDDDWTPQMIRGLKTKIKNLEKKGYREALEWAPAKAIITGGTGKGLSGAHSCHVAVIRIDGGYQKEV